VAISVALIWWLLASVDLGQLRAQLVRTDWRWLTLAAAFGIAGLWVRAWRWHYLFPPGSNPPGLVPAIMIGYMVNNVLPLRAGEFVRVYVVARRWPGRFWTAAATLIVERVLDSLCIVLILGLLILVVEVPPQVEIVALVILAVDLVGISVIAAITLAPDRCRQIIGRLVRRWPRARERSLRVFETFLHGLDGIRTPRHVLPLLVMTVLVWVMPAAAAWTALRAAGLDLPLLAGWLVLAFVGLGVSIPSAPGYFGVFHFAAVKAVGVFGVPETAALGFAIAFHASQFVPVTLVGWLYLLREHVSLGEATRAIAPDAPAAGASTDRL
jgi:glycosyltransferase 2 family protein